MTLGLRDSPSFEVNQHPAPGSQRFRRIEDPRTFLISLSRQQWRALPLAFVVYPTLDGPILVFPDRRIDAAERLQLDVLQLFEQWKSAYSSDRERMQRMRTSLTWRIRRKHLARVSLACGYTWPGNPPGYIEFAPDACDG